MIHTDKFRPAQWKSYFIGFFPCQSLMDFFPASLSMTKTATTRFIIMSPAAVLIFCLTALAADPVELTITGVQGGPLENVQKALSVPFKRLQSEKGSTFWLERFEKDIPEKVREALKPYGYYGSEVRTSLQKLENNRYRLIVHVEPGRPVRIAGLGVSLQGPGKDETALTKLVAAFPLQPGDILIQPRYEQAKTALKSRAVELGYLDADFSEHVIELNPGAAQASIRLLLETGPRYRFDDVRFEGAGDYPEKFLHRFVTIKPGDVFSYPKIAETQLNLINSERFKEVIPVPLKDEASDHRVPVLIRIEEAASKRLRPGIGYATDIGPRFTLEFRDLNVSDRGHEFRSELNLSNRLQSLGAGYIIPGKNIDTMTGLQANLKREDVTTYTTSNASVELNRSMSVGRGRLGTIYFRLEKEKSTVADAPIDSRIVLPGVRFSEQRLDNLVRPTRGRHYSIDLRGTHEAIGSNNQFLQAVGDGSLLVPLPWRLSLYSRVKAGVTVQNAPPETLPVSYRFFAGGDRSVRGYAYQSLGPKDESGKVLGGRNILVGSLELDRALFKNWGVAVFYDAGNAFNYYGDFDLFQGAGIGVRYYTIVGALRLDVARQIGVNDPSYRVHLTVGFAF
jgi:translocation and assembly module TamA